MPAYRSEAEAEVRGAVVDYLRQIRPQHRIIHEINASGQGSNRIDVLSVGEAEIIAVEVKSAKDKLDRLEDQMKAMQGVSHCAIAAIHEKHLIEKESNSYAAHYVRDGQYFRKDLPGKHSYRYHWWVYPKKMRSMNGVHDTLHRWHGPRNGLQTALPDTAIKIFFGAKN